MTYIEGTDPITVLEPEESMEYLGTQSMGRLVVRRKDDMDIFPVNYVISEGAVYFRTAEGNKLFSLNLNHDVLFEVDHVEGENAWSVVIKGQAGVVTDLAEIHKADALPLKPWIPTLKYNWVKITPTSISGRYFELGDEPERY
ncbi:pyridoxamine 5'-phosphate oxidase family protein [Corynebacterium vitaeruminis]|uniref:pyridoxamine 5'-phosphate oxidase family protein n=1 Tax=Corynebacterium vitaeruminis TaxID=38305 RepID=UPI00054D143F|nr:pyridoxamine 5'-phosphate oxidase family protein [Corynebacterium vitaeruminis]